MRGVACSCVQENWQEVNTFVRACHQAAPAVNPPTNIIPLWGGSQPGSQSITCIDAAHRLLTKGSNQSHCPSQPDAAFDEPSPNQVLLGHARDAPPPLRSHLPISSKQRQEITTFCKEGFRAVSRTRQVLLACHTEQPPEALHPPSSPPPCTPCLPHTRNSPQIRQPSHAAPSRQTCHVSTCRRQQQQGPSGQRHPQLCCLLLLPPLRHLVLPKYHPNQTTCTKKSMVDSAGRT